MSVTGMPILVYILIYIYINMRDECDEKKTTEKQRFAFGFFSDTHDWKKKTYLLHCGLVVVNKMGSVLFQGQTKYHIPTIHYQTIFFSWLFDCY